MTSFLRYSEGTERPIGKIGCFQPLSKLPESSLEFAHGSRIVT